MTPTYRITPPPHLILLLPYRVEHLEAVVEVGLEIPVDFPRPRHRHAQLLQVGRQGQQEQAGVENMQELGVPTA